MSFEAEVGDSYRIKDLKGSSIIVLLNVSKTDGNLHLDALREMEMITECGKSLKGYYNIYSKEKVPVRENSSTMFSVNEKKKELIPEKGTKITCKILETYAR